MLSALGGRTGGWLGRQFAALFWCSTFGLSAWLGLVVTYPMEQGVPMACGARFVVCTVDIYVWQIRNRWLFGGEPRSPARWRSCKRIAPTYRDLIHGCMHDTNFAENIRSVRRVPFDFNQRASEFNRVTY
jgi:hypothetical protein